MARVLVVDDQEDVRDLVAVRLRAAGHTVVLAADARAAIAAVDDAGGVDVAVLDVGLPGVEGFELLEELRRRWPGMPAVFLTVRWSLEDLVRGQRLGAEYLRKPLDVPQLIAAIDRAVDAAGTGG